MKEELWFKAKRYGWGWYPITWQGWSVVSMYVASVLFSFIFIDNQTHLTSSSFWILLPQNYILTVFLIIICYAKGEEPKWRWGEDK